MTTSPNHTKLKFIDLTKEIEDCSKDQNLSVYHYQAANSGGQSMHSGSQRKKINKRFRNNPGFASNFFFFPSSVAVNGNTSANMAINKDGSCASSSSSSSCCDNTSTVSTPTPRRWSLQTKQNEKMAAANPCEGAPVVASQQDEKGNEMIMNEDTCHPSSIPPQKKSPQSATSRGKRPPKGRLQRRFSCSDYLPTKGSMMTEQDLASIESIYSPMSSYCITPNSQFVNFTFSSPDAPSQPSPPTTTNTTTTCTTVINGRYEGTSSDAIGNNDLEKVIEFEEEWDFLDPNSKKRRPSFDINQDEMDKLFHAFSFEPIQENDHTPQSSSGGAEFDGSEIPATVDEINRNCIVKNSEDQLMTDQALVQDGYVNLLQDMSTGNDQITSETELLFNSLPEEMKQQLVSFFLLQSNNGEQPSAVVSNTTEVSSDEPTQDSTAETKENEKRSTSTTQEIDNMLENVSDQPLFEPITEIGLSELKEFGLFEDLEEATLRASNSNDDFENFLNNL
ncbi:predicted protein [Naegleria gruberi]|uniref:Predicted protein n=1 Tax=Naegleria gruberi TaxID=5762 RepID=D2W1H0_NAEGR|nr:uncharacterized protein NAEGRDRAFT_75215 [Naegleria gruberi]EFC37045.1 predicted protein [Naegleria gruberi]|eukprot:XP_002669789.1 predicted protein [Naegleria gruberi strain NEG-M]